VKTLSLLRHAHASSAGPDEGDLERALDSRGRAEAAHMATRVADGPDAPQLALCSPARRARETLAAVERERPDLAVVVDEGLYLASAGEILSRVQDLESELSHVLVVGHNPGIAALCRHLAGADGSFPPAFLAQIALDRGEWRDFAPGRGRLVELVRPKD
jgi:phosphohistidine phosphatase